MNVSLALLIFLCFCIHKKLEDKVKLETLTDIAVMYVWTARFESLWNLGCVYIVLSLFQVCACAGCQLLFEPEPQLKVISLSLDPSWVAVCAGYNNNQWFTVSQTVFCGSFIFILFTHEVPSSKPAFMFASTWRPEAVQPDSRYWMQIQIQIQCTWRDFEVDRCWREDQSHSNSDSDSVSLRTCSLVPGNIHVEELYMPKHTCRNQQSVLHVHAATWLLVWCIITQTSQDFAPGLCSLMQSSPAALVLLPAELQTLGNQLSRRGQQTLYLLLPTCTYMYFIYICTHGFCLVCSCGFAFFFMKALLQKRWKFNESVALKVWLGPSFFWPLCFNWLWLNFAWWLLNLVIWSLTSVWCPEAKGSCHSKRWRPEWLRPLEICAPCGPERWW